MSELKVGSISLRIWNDGYNLAKYTFSNDNSGNYQSIEINQKEAEVLVAALKPLVKQNKAKKN